MIPSLRERLTTHARYARYVARHKWLVLRAGWWMRTILAEAGLVSEVWWRWWWRLLVHDLSKLRPREWRPYAYSFYGPATPNANAVLRRENPLTSDLTAAQQADTERARDLKAAYNMAWLAHQHRNPHHWQHWILRQDDGRTLLLLPPAEVVDEMLCDWLAAGPKALRPHTFAEALIETIRWYVATNAAMQLRQPVRDRIEQVFVVAARITGVSEWAHEVRSATAARQSLTIPGREATRA